jgi:hypothetical protein
MASEDRVSPHSLRNLDIYERRMRGEKIPVLAAEYGVNESRISQICTEVRRTLPDRSREELVKINHDQLEFLRDEVLRLAQMSGAPVTAGQHGDVLIDPDTGETVRDYSLRVKALQEAHRLILSKNKMLGLDAPTEVKTSGSVRYEIVGVDPEALT